MAIAETTQDSAGADACRRFEAAWRAGPRPDLAAFLPPSDNSLFLPTLESLIALDLEFAWREHCAAATLTGGEGSAAPCVEGYLQRFPSLSAERESLRRLIRKEWGVRRACGDAPSVEEYERRFPRLADEIREAFAEGMSEPAEPAEPGPMLPTPGAARGRYRLTVEQGRGGFGLVWRARDDALGRDVAVKELLGAAAGDRAAQIRFLAEARIAAQLQHPGVVPIYDIGDQSDRPYYAMKLVSGQTFSEAIAHLHDPKRTPGERAVERARLLGAFLSVTRTMAFAHARQVVHRDLKPNNIILGDYGETIILDWGLAKVLTDGAPEGAPVFASPDPIRSPELTAPGVVLGTPSYMSPEQALGKTGAIDERSDVFSLGAILYHLLTGRRPFVGADSAEVMRHVVASEPPRPRAIRSDLARPLEAICLKAMAKAREHRYPDAAALTADLERHLADEPVEAYAEPWTARLGRMLRRRRQEATLAGSAIVLLAMLTAATLFVRAAHDQRDREAAARWTEANEAAAASEASGMERLRSGDFAAAKAAFALASETLAPWQDAADRRGVLDAKGDRAGRLAEFYRLHDRIWRLNFHEYDDEVQEIVPPALELIGLDGNAKEWEALPTADLTELQVRQLREDAHGLILLQTITLAKAVLSDFKHTAKVKEGKEALAWCARAQKRQPTQTIGMLEIILRCSTGEMNALFLPFALRLQPIRSPTTPTDFHCMGAMHQLLAEARRAQSQKGDAEKSDLWKFVEFVQTLADSGLDFADPHLASQRHFREVTRLEPRRYWVYHFLGGGLLRQGDHLGAELAFNTCVTLRPDAAEGYAGRAAALFLQGKKSEDKAVQKELWRRCRADLEEALRYGRHLGEIRYQRADILAALPDERDALVEEMAAYVETERPLRRMKEHWNQTMYRRRLETIAQAAKALRPSSAAAVVAELMALHALSRDDAVQALVADVPKDHPGRGRVEAILGEIEWERASKENQAADAEGLARARGRFETALRWTPNNYAAGIGLARIAAAEKSKKAGLSRLEAMLEQGEVWASWQILEMQLLRAEWSQATGASSDARNALRLASRINPSAARKKAQDLGLEWR